MSFWLCQERRIEISSNLSIFTALAFSNCRKNDVSKPISQMKPFLDSTLETEMKGKQFLEIFSILKQRNNPLSH